MAATEGSGSSRKAGLSKDGLAIILDDDPDSTERRNLIKKAALKPTIHAELWRRYEGLLPSDATLRTYLTRDRSFSRSGADELIREFKSTIEFAKLLESDSVGDAAEDEGKTSHDTGIQFAEDPKMTTATEKPSAGFEPPPPKAPDLRMYRLPLVQGDGDAILQLPIPISAASYRQIIAFLEVMKPGIIKKDDEAPSA